MILEERTEVEASPGAVFQFFLDIEDHYGDWHEDHEAFEWLEGDGLAEGSEARLEEHIGSREMDWHVRYVTVEPDSYIESRPQGRMMKLLVPKISFSIEAAGPGAAVTQRIEVRTGPLGSEGSGPFETIREHIHEEGVNLRRIVEGS